MAKKGMSLVLHFGSVNLRLSGMLAASEQENGRLVKGVKSVLPSPPGAGGRCVCPNRVVEGTTCVLWGAGKGEHASECGRQQPTPVPGFS